MNTIKMKPSDDTPYIVLDSENNIFQISGRSMPEDVNAFYEPVLSWIDEYMGHPNENTVFVFHLSYFNTASSKLLLDIMLRLEDLNEKGMNVSIIWTYDPDDEDMLEAGEEFNEIVDVPFEMKPAE